MNSRWQSPDLGGLAVLTLTQAGRIACWSVTAARLFGYSSAEVAGEDICDVLLTGPGQRHLVSQALADVEDGRVWTAILPVAAASGSLQVSIHCEPLEGEDARLLMIARRASAHPSQEMLTDAAAKIGTTLDLYRTASEATDVAVPAFADACVIFVSERLLVADELRPYATGPAVVVRRLVARVSGQPSAITDALLRPGEVLVYSAESPSYQAMTKREPVRFDELDPETAERIARRPGVQEMFAPYTSFLAVPLVARGLVLGCANFGRSAARPGFSPLDIALAQELASRAAVSIDNARLYARERRTASALQQGLLPSEPTAPAGLAVAHQYIPVGASIVGGDWHDIVPLRSGRAALIVGDAMGHGPEAAAIMVQLRTAAHTLADLGLEPEEILLRLDRMATAMPAAPFATCIAAIIDPAASSCVIAKAGHLPPMLTLANGESSLVDLPLGLPIGLGTGSYEAAKISLPPGATLALYTDGLVESRTRPLDDGLTALSGALSSTLSRAAGTLDDSCREITQALHSRGEDDITLVLAQVLGG
ncbi:MAG TPA: GAF domain-containing SpoIIE family protein phosphatase [Streptosporangiaceae bacterium]|nr:GAF domain-containing SpoIIE family protein phosphatase [Streptosporangiaceae bacterium]